MKKASTLKSSAGFSLVELMVVVAIIGVLAAMSVGQVNKQIAKARQSEAKTNLASVYSTENVFQGEWATFTGDFGLLSLAFNGKLRYNSGFVAVGVGAPAGYTGPAATGVFSSKGFCAANGTQCTEIPSNGVAPTVASGTVASANAFSATAHASIYSAVADIWTMTEGKLLTNTTPGIP